MEDKFTIEDVEFKEETFCEHCYDLEPFTPTIEDGARYCLDCMGNDDRLELSNEDLKVIEVMELVYKLNHYQKIFKDYQKSLIELIKDLDSEIVERLKDEPSVVNWENQ